LVLLLSRQKKNDVLFYYVVPVDGREFFKSNVEEIGNFNWDAAKD
jgi:hypothetical protein